MEFKSDSERIETLESIVVGLNKKINAHQEAIGHLIGMVRLTRADNVEVMRFIGKLAPDGSEADKKVLADNLEKITTGWNATNAMLVKIEGGFLSPPSPPPPAPEG
ncbi:MAG: hypothetical protein P4N60_22170 [Verrucomicrobiae bacterium]|nr:hypothetical protein [Verrucomicrobiae bacterium]